MIPEQKDRITADRAEMSSSITNIPASEKTRPKREDFLKGCFSMPKSPKQSIANEVAVCPKSPRATILVMLILPKAKLLKTVVNTPIAPPVYSQRGSFLKDIFLFKTTHRKNANNTPTICIITAAINIP